MDDSALQGDDEILNAFDRCANDLRTARESVESVIFGQSEVIRHSMETLLAGGHGLLVGAPGVAKTLLVDTIAAAMGLDAKRVQFTPDLMPADIVGSEVLEDAADGGRAFRFIAGPVFCQLLMADEINRASPRTQSALLQAMQERHVTVAGVRHDLPEPFHVLATQNPLEQEGTYPLPEAQLDRFIMQINVGFPDIESERRMVLATTGAERPTVQAALSPEELMRAQRLVRLMPVGEQVLDAILQITREGRPEQTSREDVKTHVAWGPGPRASQSLMLAARARALMDARPAPSLDDVMALARPVLRHRMALRFSARADGITVDGLIDSLLESVG